MSFLKTKLSVRRILIDGTLLSVLLTLIIYGSLYINPLMQIDNYPPDIQAAVGEVDVPPIQPLVVYGSFFAVVIGVNLLSNARLRSENGGQLSYWTAAANSALLMFFYAVWDLLIIDWLIFVAIRPDFIVIPGTEGFAGYQDYGFHFKVAFLGLTQWISILIGGLVFGALSMIRLRK
jgi:hypothetical protein